MQSNLTGKVGKAPEDQQQRRSAQPVTPPH